MYSSHAENDFLTTTHFCNAEIDVCDHNIQAMLQMTFQTTTHYSHDETDVFDQYIFQPC
jgi:hypothetical protein